MELTNLNLAFGLTFLAGISTGLGGLFVYFTKVTNKKLLSMALGFSAGVMLYVSFVEIFSEGQITLIEEFGELWGYAWAVVAFFIGIVIAILIEKVVSRISGHDPHVHHETHHTDNDLKDFNLHKIGILSAIALVIHSFPEGLVTFMGTLNNPSVGIAIAIAVAIHNIPIGIVIAVPIYYASKSRGKAFLYALLSGLSGPLGAVMGWLLLMPYLNEKIFGFVFTAVAGLMIYISMDELLPTAQEYGDHHHSIGGFVLGMMVMAFSLILLKWQGM